MEPKILLVTGFEPFGNETTNPSWEAVSALPERVGQYRLEKRLLPVEFGRAAEKAIAAAEVCRSDAILCVGLAASRTVVTPEAVGLNVRDASIPDNAGFLPNGDPVDPCGPAAIFSTLPVREMTDAIKQAGVPAALSYSAGTYVCNDLLYTLLRRFEGTETRVAFVHVPLKSVLPLSETVRALCAAIEAL